MLAMLRKTTTQSALALAVATAALVGDPSDLSARVVACTNACTWSCGFNEDEICAEVNGSDDCRATGCAPSYYNCDLLAPNLLRCGTGGGGEQ